MDSKDGMDLNKSGEAKESMTPFLGCSDTKLETGTLEEF